MPIHPIIKNAYKVLDGPSLTKTEAIDIANNINGNDIVDLISLANKVRQRFCGEFSPCSIINAKSGVCTQNCKFCAQSQSHNTNIDTYPLLDVAQVVKEARIVYEQGIRTYGIVTSGYGYTQANNEFRQILAMLDQLHEEFPDLKLCVSLGILSEETAKLLAEHHVYRYNMNLQTSPAKYKDLIASTHSIEEKINTIKYLQTFGVTICCGGIIGLGENWEDRIDMALAVRDLNVDGIPLNVLLPIAGTPLEKLQVMQPADVAKAFAIFRLINPTKLIKFAAGRETTMRDFQGLLMLAGANSMITGGYLTTRGRSIEDDQAFIRHLYDF